MINKEKRKYKYAIHSVETAFLLLEILAKAESELSISEICKKVNLPKGTVHRHLGTLKKLNYVEQNQKNSKYRFTFEAYRVSVSIVAKFGIRSGLNKAIPLIKKVSQDFNEMITLALLDDDRVVYIYATSSDNPLKLDFKIGYTQPAYCTALGKILLAYLSNKKLDKYLKGTKLIRFTPYTIINKKQLQDELKQIREKGYCLVNEEYILGISDLSVPVSDQQGKVFAAVGFNIPNVRLNQKNVEQLKKALFDISQKIILQPSLYY